MAFEKRAYYCDGTESKAHKKLGFIVCCLLVSSRTSGRVQLTCTAFPVECLTNGVESARAPSEKIRTSLSITSVAIAARARVNGRAGERGVLCVLCVCVCVSSGCSYIMVRERHEQLMGGPSRSLQHASDVCR